MGLAAAVAQESMMASNENQVSHIVASEILQRLNLMEEAISCTSKYCLYLLFLLRCIAPSSQRKLFC